MKTKCILFDLGGVLVELHEERALMAMCPGLDNPAKVREAWFASSAVREFETGRIGFDAFCKRAIGDLGAEVDEATFREAHTRFLGDPFPGVIRLLDVLKPNYKLACLSNTNPEHIASLRRRSDILDHLHECFLSHETGLVKPDREAFANVAGAMGLEPAEILFVDDRLKNVEAAQSFGLKAFAANSLDGIKEGLIRLGILE